VEKTGSEQLRIEFKNGEVHAVNGEVFEDKIAAIQKIEEIGAATVSAVTCTWAIRSSVSRDGSVSRLPLLC